MKTISAIDLFCGAGGLTHGLIKAKVNVIAGFDIEESCRFAYEKNNKGAKFFNNDVAKLSGAQLASLYPKGHIKLLAGCAPCQPFSTYIRGRNTSEDAKWPLLYAFANLVREIEPELVTMENVPNVTKHKVYHDFVEELEALGYSIWADKVFCPDYGMPQRRMRHVLLASKLAPISLIAPTRTPDKYETVKKAIGKLPHIKAGEQSKIDPLHKSAGLSPLNLRRMQASKPGGSWWDWPESLRADCHQKVSGHTYSGVYARMRWDEPSPTMTTQCYGFGNGRFGHPDQDRAISLREAAILQTFPRSYKFTPKGKEIENRPIGRMIGNAVPVQLGKVIGISLYNHVTADTSCIY